MLLSMKNSLPPRVGLVSTTVTVPTITKKRKNRSLVNVFYLLYFLFLASLIAENKRKQMNKKTTFLMRM